MSREYFAAYHSYLKSIELLSDAERGRLFTACLSYSMTGIEPELRGNEKFAWSSIRSQIDRDNEKYIQICEINSKNALRRYTTVDDRLQMCATKDKDKAKEKNLDEDDPLSPRAKQDQLITIWIDLFGRYPSQVQSDDISGWLETWDYELMKEAINSAAEANAGNPVSYITKTLADWKSRDINTIEKWAVAEAKRDGII